MIDAANLRIFVCAKPTNMTYSFDTLMGLAQEIFAEDPTSGHLFVFFNRVRDRVKILYWDQDGFCIWYKRLEAGAFQMLTATGDQQGMELEYWQLAHLLEGLDLQTGRRRQRYRRVS